MRVLTQPPHRPLVNETLTALAQRGLAEKRCFTGESAALPQDRRSMPANRLARIEFETYGTHRA
jgi:hypothetical protein